MSDLMNSLNDFSRLPHHTSSDGAANSNRNGKKGIKPKKLSIPYLFKSEASTQTHGLIEGVKFLNKIASSLQAKCTLLGRQVLRKQLAALKQGALSYDEFKAKNSSGSALLFTEHEKQEFRDVVNRILDSTKPGLAKAIEMFGDRMCHQMGIGEPEIAAAIIPHELEALSSGRLNYLDFRERNTYYVFESMTDREMEIARVAFLKLGSVAYDSQDFEMDREILLDPDCYPNLG